MVYRANSRICYVISTPTGIHPRAYLDRTVANRVARAMLRRRGGRIVEEYQDEERCFRGATEVDDGEEEFSVAQVEVADEEDDEEEWEDGGGYNSPREEEQEEEEVEEAEVKQQMEREVKKEEVEGGERKKRRITG